MLLKNIPCENHVPGRRKARNGPLYKDGMMRPASDSRERSTGSHLSCCLNSILSGAAEVYTSPEPRFPVAQASKSWPEDSSTRSEKTARGRGSYVLPRSDPQTSIYYIRYCLGLASSRPSSNLKNTEMGHSPASRIILVLQG